MPRWLRKRRAAKKAIKYTRGWWLTLPVIVGGQCVDVELLVDLNEVPAVLETWRRNGLRSGTVSYSLRFGYGQTAPQRHGETPTDHHYVLHGSWRPAA